MTRSDHPSGSDRIAEVAARCDCDAVVNIQGDEPLLDPSVIDAVAGALRNAEMSTAATLIQTPEEYDSPNVVKVVVSASGHALYFSRRTIPFVRDAASRSRAEQLAAFPFLKHLGIYGYLRETLLRLVKFPVSPLESAEKLEQLRALENGIQIAVVQVNYDSVGVDAPEDVARVETLLSNVENLRAMKKLTYEVVIEREENPKAGYSVYCPDLPGCFSNGGSIAEAKKNMAEAIALHRESLRALGKRSRNRNTASLLRN
jgi:3-deoxy-manno-octulosonate cytidylyltransferase (CMP-KDO synthetase)